MADELECYPTPSAPRIYLAGAIEQFNLDLTIGRRVLETFAYIKPGTGAYRPLWEGAMLDSGAFSAYASGVEIDRGAYREFVVEKGDFYESVAALDDITDWRKSVANWRFMEDLGVFPTYHEGEPPELFREYAEEQLDKGGWVGFGAQRPIVPERLVRVLKGHREALGNLAHEVHIHGFGLTMYTSVFPFKSTDSTLWVLGLQKLMGFTPLNHLAKRELMNILLARLDRAPLRLQWDPKWRDVVSKTEARRSSAEPLESILDLFGDPEENLV